MDNSLQSTTVDYKMDPQLMGTPPYGEAALQPPQAEVNDFLRKKRKAREHKACYPCRRRKVKCDLSRPCQTCRDRDHPELCSYHPPNKRQNADGPSTTGMSRPTDDESHGLPISQDQGYVTLERNAFDLLCHKLNGLENSIADLRREIRQNSYEDHNGIQESDGSSEGPRVRTHADLHGLHTTNESVSVKCPT